MQLLDQTRLTDYTHFETCSWDQMNWGENETCAEILEVV